MSEQRDLDGYILKLEHESVFANIELGKWMSAALDDPKVCDAMKDDVRRWFSSGYMYWNDVLHRMETAADERQALIVKWLREYEFGCDELDNASLEFAVAIERGEHLQTKPD